VRQSGEGWVGSSPRTDVSQQYSPACCNLYDCAVARVPMLGLVGQPDSLRMRKVLLPVRARPTFPSSSAAGNGGPL